MSCGQNHNKPHQRQNNNNNFFFIFFLIQTIQQYQRIEPKRLCTKNNSKEIKEENEKIFKLSETSNGFKAELR